MAWRPGRSRAVWRISVGVSDSSSSAVSREPQRRVGPGGQLGQRSGRRAAPHRQTRNVAAPICAAASRDSSSSASSAPWYALVGQLDQLGLDLGTEHGAQLVGVDRGCDTARGPGRPALPDRNAGRLPTANDRSPGTGVMAIRSGQLGFLAGRRARAASCLDAADDLGPIDLGPVCRIDREGELVVDPAGERSAAPVGLEELAGRSTGRLSGSHSAAFSVRNSSRSSWPELELVAVGDGDTCCRSFSLRFRSNRLLAQFARACQVHSEGSASDGRFSSIACADRVGELALGLGLGDFLGVLEAGALEVAGGQLDPEPLAGPLRRSWLRHSRRPGTAWRRPRPGLSIISKIISLGGAPSSRLWRNE